MIASCTGLSGRNEIVYSFLHYVEDGTCHIESMHLFFPSAFVHQHHLSTPFSSYNTISVSSRISPRFQRRYADDDLLSAPQGNAIPLYFQTDVRKLLQTWTKYQKWATWMQSSNPDREGGWCSLPRAVPAGERARGSASNPSDGLFLWWGNPIWGA